MIAKVLVAVCRVACITAALILVAPLVPGITFTGSLFSALAIGGGLWLLYELSRVALSRFYRLPKASCPTPPMMRKLTVIYVIWSVAYVAIIGMLIATPLHVTNPLSALAGGLIALAGAILSNIFDRLLAPAPEKAL